MTARSATIERTFEVYVRDGGIQKMLHFDAVDFHRAILKARQAGYHPLGAHKVDEAIAGDRKMLGLHLGSVIGITLPPENKPSALAMENIAFKRARRIENNLKKDKIGID
jgi:hypothetical protein